MFTRAYPIYDTEVDSRTQTESPTDISIPLTFNFEYVCTVPVPLLPLFLPLVASFFARFCGYSGFSSDFGGPLFILINFNLAMTNLSYHDESMRIDPQYV